MAKTDFEFLIGTWRGENRRLSKALVGADDWTEFPGELECRPVLGGAGNVEEVTFPTLNWSGLTIRLYLPETDEWAIHWVSGKTGILDGNPVIGAFADGVGLFYADDWYDGTPIRVRFKWSDISADSARWEQAFSVDGGHTWETNWVNVMTRA